MAAGRPATFDSPESMQEAIDAYFDDPPMAWVTVGKEAVEVPRLTITGLALHLGFESRQSFYDYEKREAFSYTIKRARLRVEHEYEKALQSASPAGSIFALKNLGWSDKQEIDHTTQGQAMQPTRIELVAPSIEKDADNSADTAST